MSFNKKADCGSKKEPECSCSKCIKKINKRCNEIVKNTKKIEKTLTREILHITEVNVYPKTKIVHKYEKVYIHHPEVCEETFSDCEKVKVVKCVCKNNQDGANCKAKDCKFSNKSCESVKSCSNESESEVCEEKPVVCDKKSVVCDKKKQYKKCSDKKKKQSKKANCDGSESSSGRYNMLWE
jgi:hypothetical protein